MTTVRLFAVAAELAGARSIEVDLADRATADAVLDRICEAVPALAPHRETFALAAGDRIVAGNTEIGTDEELAVIPPVSGG